VKFRFILAEKDTFPVSALCRNLEVSRQGYYAFLKRPPSRRAQREEELRSAVLRIFEASRGTYGSPRILAALKIEGWQSSKRCVERVMRELGLLARQSKRYRVTTLSDARHPVAGNTLDRDFTASAPDQRWVTDITYVWTAEGWVYLAAIVDLFSRAVVGWALEDDLSTDLPLKALENAVMRRRPEPGLLHHSDRGCQYTSREYRERLADQGIEVSMSRRGNCWDNAVAESFFATLKVELISRQGWTHRRQLRAAVFDYIETFYNRERLHSTLGYRTPAQVEAEHQLERVA
jgi:putative transposase